MAYYSSYNYYVSLKEFRADPKAFNANQIRRMCRSQVLSKKFIRDMKDELDWDAISRYQKLDVEFMKEMKDYINWTRLIRWNRKVSLTEQFMDEMEQWMDWGEISCSRKFSKEFMMKHLDKLNPDRMCDNHYLRDLKENFEEFVGPFLKIDRTIYHWNNYNYSNITFDFIREYADVVSFNKLVCHFMSEGKYKEFVEEFHKYFTDEAWMRIQANMHTFDFDFIVKWSDHWKYNDYNNPVNYRYGTKFTPEQKEFLIGLWKAKR